MRLRASAAPPTASFPTAFPAHTALSPAAGDGADFRLIEGELITPQYFDTVALEVAEELEAAGSLALSDLARRLSLSVDLLTSALQSRLGRLVRLAAPPAPQSHALGRALLPCVALTATHQTHLAPASPPQWHGRMEGGLLYTDAYVLRLSCQMRGVRARLSPRVRLLNAMSSRLR